MALEQGNQLVGQIGQIVGDAVNRVTSANPPAAFADPASPATDQPAGSAAAAGPATAHHAVGAAAGTTVPAVGPDPSPANGGADPAATPTPAPASFGAVVVAFALIAGAGFASWSLWASGGTAKVMQPPDTVAVFGVLIVFAAAVERILEPFSRWLPGRGAEATLQRLTAELANRPATATERASLGQLRERADRARGNRTIVAWGIATAVATVASTAGGFYVLHAIAGPEWEGLPVWIDGIVTGIMVGSGTKPLHDLITRIQSGGGQS
ncbi:hypothetical protein [Plantactinospora sp. B5E13]|uniref:hypothetical protein n=1 Tax=Plantactinospora sp. B5E13 TaxID=3153758 RepID=UPI00325C950C